MSSLPPPPPPPPPPSTVPDGAPAAIAQRVGARILDAVAVFVLILPLLAVDAAIRAATGRPSSTPEGQSDPLDAVMGLSAMVLVFAYEAATTRWGGATLGKRALGLRVVSHPDGGRVSALLVTVRLVIQVVMWSLCVVGIIDLVVGAQDPQRRTWHDRMTGTGVVRGRGRAGTTPAAGGLPPPWGGLVDDAVAARQRFEQVVATVRGGPTRDRLRELQRPVDECVTRCRSTAARGAQLQGFAAGVDATAVRARLAAAEADVAADPGDRHAVELRDALRSELTSATRLADLVDDTERALRRLVSQLNDAINRAAEVAFLPGDDGGFATVVDRVESLRQGFADVEAATIRPSG